MGGSLNVKKIKKVKFYRFTTLILLLICALLLALDATLLRSDNLKMVELRDAVIAADKAEEDETVISQKLEELKEFTFSHIVLNMVEYNGNQSLSLGTGVFYLEQQYIRAATAALEEAEAAVANIDDNPNGNVFKEASDVCKPIAIANGWTWASQGYLDCMTSEIANHPTEDSLQVTIYANIPSTELYRKNYASPIWAPCASGFAILATLIVLFMLFMRFAFWVFLKIAILFIRNR